MDMNSFLITAALAFLIIGCCVALSVRLNIGSVVGFIIAGVILGPNTPGLVASSNVETLQSVADFGVVLFLFTLGLEMRPKQLWSMRKTLALQGMGQVALTGACFTIVAVLFDVSWEVGLVLGLILAQSSTAVVVSMLADKRELGTSHGKNIFANLMGQDMSIVLVMGLIPILAHSKVENQVGLLEKSLVFVGVITLIVLMARLVLPKLLVWSAKLRSKEAFVLMLASAILVTVLCSQQAGLSETMGVFLLGMLLSDSEFKHILEEVVAPIKGILMSLFFLAVGMSMDPNIIAGQPVLILGLLVTTILVKFSVFFGLAIMDRKGKLVATKTAFALAQVGEFAFVLFGVAQAFELLSTQTVSIGFVVISLSMIATPWLYEFGKRILDALITKQDLKHEDGSPNCELVVVGLDEVGRLVCMMAEKAGISYVGYDLDYDRVSRSKALNINAHFGDILSMKTQQRSGLKSARASFISVTESSRLRKIAQVLLRYKGIEIYARTNSKLDEQFLKKIGVTHASSVYIESTISKGRELLSDFNIDEKEIANIARELRTELVG
jgi:glutathione-regulated potassium-efflux system protein KefB